MLVKSWKYKTWFLGVVIFTGILYFTQLILLLVASPENDETIMSAEMIHIKCRGGIYPSSKIQRLVFPDEKVPWFVKFDDYAPPEYNAPSLLNKPWADKDIGDEHFNPKWNQLDGNINRKSHIGIYEIVNSRPLNPLGRTGLSGRGLLGKWGPNHAADPIVTRWKLIDGLKQFHSFSKMPILQFCAIQRRDSGEWAIPGGMVDPGEHVSQTLKREFLEEAFNSLDNTTEKTAKNKHMVEEFFKKGQEIYKGYVDDPRNTDNAWMETVAYNFHDDDGQEVGQFELEAGDDAQNIQWMDINRDLELYASHSKLIKAVVDLRGAHW